MVFIMWHTLFGLLVFLSWWQMNMSEQLLEAVSSKKLKPLLVS
jgi:hypothetical protein